MANLLNRFIVFVLIYMSTNELALAGYADEVKRDVEGFKKTVFVEDSLLVFHSPVFLQLKEETVLRGLGSKLILTPLGVKLGSFKDMVEWELGFPRNLEGTLNETSSYSFDLIQRIRIKKKLTVKIERETENDEDDEVNLLFEKGSPIPEVVRSGKCELKKR